MTTNMTRLTPPGRWGSISLRHQGSCWNTLDMCLIEHDLHPATTLREVVCFQAVLPILTSRSHIPSVRLHPSEKTLVTSQSVMSLWPSDDVLRGLLSHSATIRMCFALHFRQFVVILDCNLWGLLQCSYFLHIAYYYIFATNAIVFAALDSSSRAPC